MLTPPILLHLRGPPDESRNSLFRQGRADPAPGESWFGRVSLGESARKWQANAKKMHWALKNSAERHGSEALERR
jgi:hypothetical protein